jgi:hypothetical protein
MQFLRLSFTEHEEIRHLSAARVSLLTLIRLISTCFRRDPFVAHIHIFIYPWGLFTLISDVYILEVAAAQVHLASLHVLMECLSARIDRIASLIRHSLSLSISLSLFFLFLSIISFSLSLYMSPINILQPTNWLASLVQSLKLDTRRHRPMIKLYSKLNLNTCAFRRPITYKKGIRLTTAFEENV